MVCMARHGIVRWVARSWARDPGTWLPAEARILAPSYPAWDTVAYLGKGVKCSKYNIKIPYE